MSFCLRIFKVTSFGSGSGSNQMESSEIRFGRFRLDLRRRTLLRDDLPVRLGGRPPAILFALASAGGDVLTQNELMARLWSGYVVEEGNLYVHVSALRRALADRSVSGRVRRHDVAREYGARMTEEWLPLTLIGSGRNPPSCCSEVLF